MRNSYRPHRNVSRCPGTGRRWARPGAGEEAAELCLPWWWWWSALEAAAGTQKPAANFLSVSPARTDSTLWPPRAPRAAFKRGRSSCTAGAPPLGARRTASASIWVSSIPPRACVYARRGGGARFMLRCTERGWMDQLLLHQFPSLHLPWSVHAHECKLLPRASWRYMHEFHVCTRAPPCFHTSVCVSERAPPGACLPVCVSLLRLN